MRQIRPLLALTAMAAAACVLPSGASASGTCSYDAGTHTVTVVLDSSPGRSFLTAAKDGAISFDSLPCGGATTTNTDAVQASTTGSRELDVNGVFEPGFTPEATGRSEIEFAVHGISVVNFEVPGSATTAAAGTLGINLNGDDDVDVTVDQQTGVLLRRQHNPPRALVHQGVTITGQGGFATGGPFPSRFLTLIGGKGDDHLIAADSGTFLRGLAGNDTLDGGPGDDIVEADAGNDTLNGAGGDDNLAGDAGNDVITGGSGSDTIGGGSGNDAIHATDGEADLVDGGPDTDTADFDAGLDTVKNVP